MKKQLILAIIALVAVATTSLVSAEPSWNPPTKNVVALKIKDMLSGYVYADFQFPQPIAVQAKTCPGDQKRDCLYAVSGKQEKKLYDYNNQKMIMVTYITETKITVARR